VISDDWKFIPSKSLGGGAFGYHWRDENHFVIYLIDVSGHGVGAALLSVSVINSLRSQSLPNSDFRDPALLLAALNEAFSGEKNNYMFFTIWYGVYNKNSRELVYASGGHPPALFLDNRQIDNAGFTILRTANAAIGAMPDIRKNTHIAAEDGTLCIFSDGVYEIEKADGTMWQLSEFIEFMRKWSKADLLDNLFQHVQRINSKDGFEDDFTILAATFR
jgi:phosphoserine phosphatase RsbU/P